MNSEESLFADAVAKPEAERDAFLARACGGDTALRERVDALLRAYGGEGARLEESPFAAAAGEARSALAGVAHDYRPGVRIDRYKLLQRLGEGGCGVVFMAEQEEPVRRRVALKVIKLGMDTREVIARFEAERQALALMDHPNIAHVLDAGATESGRPFFVMELVRGVPITRHCDEQQLGTAERLRLFIQVCSAVQHAHQKGIIHRDLKPTNILVTLHDGVPVPKVIDFGIAKATQGRLTDKTLFTAFEQFIGTPAYMAPEQAEMSAFDVDTRSDIYSLGVLLYELLTGRTPFESQELAKAGLDEMRRIIRKKEPPKPSTRVSTIDGVTCATIAKQRGTEPAKLSALLRGDLDWIVMRCLEKDRTRRYETANGLAMDLERHLRNEPVAARPPGTAYLLQRVIRRNKLAFAAGAAVVAALAIGLILALGALQREQAARRRADRESARSAQVARFMQDMLASVGPQVALGGDTKLLRTILNETVERMQQELRGQPEVEADLREALGQVYRDLGEYAAAKVMHERALQLRRALFGEEHPAVASSLHELGDVCARQGRLSEAEAMLRAALAIRESGFGPGHAATADSRAVLAHVRARMQPPNTESRGKPAPTPGTPPVEGAFLSAEALNLSNGAKAERPDSANRSTNGSEISRDKPVPTPEAAPAVIRMAIFGGISEGKPRFTGVLNLAYQQRALENEFNPEGIRVEWSFISNIRELVETHSRNLSDFSSLGPVSAVKTRVAGVDDRILLTISPVGSRAFSLVVRADSTIRTAADLHGKQIGIHPGSGVHLTLCRILEKLGLGEKDVAIIFLDSRAAIRTAFESGEIDARMLGVRDELDDEQRRAVRVVYDPGRNPGFAPDRDGKLCVTAEFERRYPAIVQRVVTTLVKAAAWMSEEQNRKSLLDGGVISREDYDPLTNGPADYSLKESVSPLMDEHFLAALRRDIDDMKRFGFISTDADTSLEGWIEPKYLQRALEELNLVGFWPERDADGKPKDGR